MMMTAFLQRELATDRLVQQVGTFEPDFVGPPRPPPFSESGFEWVLMSEPIRWSECPSPRHILKWNGGAPTWAETLSLAEFKAHRTTEIIAARVAADADHFVFQGKKIAVDEASFRQMQATCSWVAMTNTMPPNWPGGWKAMDGAGYVQFSTVPEWVAFYGAMLQAGLANFNRSVQLQACIENATMHDQVAAIHW
jgi:hypothetical protein